jgi:crotonobetainyl-CoA:carnitine CoA-transferase CaiB-like acyl-CoA transferase
MGGALEGIKVLDLTRHAPGPYCTMILGDLGADILRVEGSVSDLVAPEFPPPNSPYEPLARNKRSIILNLKAEVGKEILYRLAKQADVVVEGFRPGVVKRLGVDYDTLKRINERIVYCSITGYGQDGPYRDMVGHDLNYLAQGGLLGILKDPAYFPGNIAGDLVSGGMQGVIGILSALVARQTTGKGQYVDISMGDGVVALIALYIAKYLETGAMPPEETRATVGGTHYYNVYRTRDGKFISVAAGETRFFATLCTVLGCEQFAPYQFDDKKAPEIKDYFTRTFLTKTRDEWFDILSKNDTAVGKVLAPDELVSDPHVLHRQMIVEIDDPMYGKVRQAGIPVKLSETPGKIRNLGSRPGEDTAQVLASLGYSEAAIQELSDTGIVGIAPARGQKSGR